MGIVVYIVLVHAHFPPVLEPLGEPLIIQDVKGKDWELNFRFWPNNNSRMYILEEFSPLVKSMDLEEGDTVTRVFLIQDDPVIARPTIMECHDGTLIQWAQCEGCYKRRKVASDVVIPAGWTCSLNEWDPQRSHCSAREEMMSNKPIKKIFSRTSDEDESSKRMKIGNHQPEPPETVVGRDAVAVVPPTLPSPAIV
ncbi:hypothetical protein L6452_31847 [Arctium lappa]|uniref:Uncharacterized protein n=1 Tax=Arctium lappa TaxID=4217 RepID=A0ACB8Z243_ARCLA|nr:hypothetical protein L6452_31847 [Arctium lappa]